MPAGYSFRPRAWVLALAALACAAFIALGNWQTRRADEKRALGARLETVSVSGSFGPKDSVMLDKQLRPGKAGHQVGPPLRPPRDHPPVPLNRRRGPAPPTRQLVRR